MKLKTKQNYTCIPHVTKVTNSKTKTEVKIKIPRDRLPMKLLIYQKTENFPTLEISPSILMVVGSGKTIENPSNMAIQGDLLVSST